jgi:hypothetical protein
VNARLTGTEKHKAKAPGEKKPLPTVGKGLATTVWLDVARRTGEGSRPPEMTIIAVRLLPSNLASVVDADVAA